MTATRGPGGPIAERPGGRPGTAAGGERHGGRLWARWPALYASGEGERRATWLELFFDLVFVLAIAELANYLHDHLTLAGVAGFVLLSLPVWLVWSNFSYYADLFDVGGPLYATTGARTPSTTTTSPQLRPLARLAKRRVVWDWFGKGPDPDLSSELSALFGDTELSAGLLPLLGMGRDVPDGHMRLRAGRLHVDWKKQKSGPYFDRVRETSRAMAHQLGAHFVDDPLWYMNRLITVHPLGDCPMGRDPREGVVDAHGEVFGYPGLYVTDGSVMPGPVGVNPSLTIAAVADRSAESLLATAKRRGRGEPVSERAGRAALHRTDDR